jgi:hypothetical protein
MNCDDRPQATEAPSPPTWPAHDFRFPKRRKTMFKNKWLVGAALAGLLAVSGAAQAASVSFVQPADGATVSNPVHVVFGVDGMKIAPAGTMTEGTGHHHLLVDGKPLPKGEVIPANDKSLHFGKGQTETDLTLPPGDHTLTLQFGDAMRSRAIRVRQAGRSIYLFRHTGTRPCARYNGQFRLIAVFSNSPCRFTPLPEPNWRSVTSRCSITRISLSKRANASG